MRLADGDYWVDDYGAWNHVPPGQLCPFFPNPAVRIRNAIDLAFRRLGMVRVSKRSGTVTVQWDIAEACDESLNSACAFLWDVRGILRIKLRFYFGGWTQEIFGSVRDALIRLEVLRSYRHIAPFPSVRITPIGQEAIENTATPAIRRMRDLVAKSGRLFDGDFSTRLAAENFTDRILLFREEDGGSRLSYRYIGQRSLFTQVLGPEVSKRLIGQHIFIAPATSQRGCSYSRAYPQVLASGMEQIDQVLAPIKQNDDDGIWLSYQRILVPCSARSGRRLLLVVTDPTEESLIAA